MNLNSYQFDRILHGSPFLWRKCFWMFWLLSFVFFYIMFGITFAADLLSSAEETGSARELNLLARIIPCALIGVIYGVLASLFYGHLLHRKFSRVLKQEIRRELLERALSPGGRRTLPVEVKSWTTRVIDGLEHFVLKAVGLEQVFIYQNTDNRIYLALKSLQRGDLIGLHIHEDSPESMNFVDFEDIELQLEQIAGKPRLRIVEAA